MWKGHILPYDFVNDFVLLISNPDNSSNNNLNKYLRAKFTDVTTEKLCSGGLPTFIVILPV